MAFGETVADFKSLNILSHGQVPKQNGHLCVINFGEISYVLPFVEYSHENNQLGLKIV